MSDHIVKDFNTPEIGLYSPIPRVDAIRKGKAREQKIAAVALMKLLGHPWKGLLFYEGESADLGVKNPIIMLFTAPLTFQI